MQTRWLVILGAVILVMVVAAGLALAAPGSGGDGSGGWRGGMHGSPSMREMHEQMPADLQARCDEMHARMDDHMGGMMGGGMMVP
jgi:hypothetical protein